MKRYFFTLLLLASLSAFAELSIKNEKDRVLLEDSVILSSKLLAADSKSIGGNALLKFASWLDGTDKRVKTMKAKAIFGDKIEALAGAITEDLFIRKILNRQEELKSSTSTRMLFIVVGNTVAPTNSKMSALYSEFSNYELNLDKLLKDAPKPEKVDLAAEKAQAEKEAVQIERDNKTLKQSYTTGASAEDIELIIDGTKFKAFNYSESTVLDAINRITHKLYWRGVQMKIQGNRISYASTTKATNGAVYYHGPLQVPNFEEYSVENKTVRQVLDHISTNIRVLWKVQDGMIVFYDDQVPSPEIPEGGLAANNMKVLMKGSLKELLKYRGKVIEMNGLVTGIGRHDYKTDFLSLDGGSVRVYVKKEDMNEKVYKRLDTSVDNWKKEGGGKSALLKKMREMKEAGEDIDRRTVGNAAAFVQFKAKVDGIDRGRLVFKEITYIKIEESGEYLIKNMN
ncbi:MAG: hypothetical protein NE330_11720 [Lentisphaeraceae bacterium]|nr:hypothetical protein [Lentisphaeraceae bacterium]